MISKNGCPRFCEACPAANAVEGDIVQAHAQNERYIVEELGIAYVDAYRTIHLVGENGGLSVPIAGKPKKYTDQGDMRRVMENVGKCQGPRERSIERRFGTWFFSHTETVHQIRCGAIRGWEDIPVSNNE